MGNKPFILFKYATRSRPQQMLKVLQNLIAHIGDKDNYVIAITADKDDFTMYNKTLLTQLKRFLKSGKVVIEYNDYNNKVEAVNGGIKELSENYKWDIIVPISDFIEFHTKGFDDIIRDQYVNKDGWTYDLISFPAINSNGYECYSLITITHDTYEREKCIYNPKLKSNYCVEELMHRIGSYMCYHAPFFYYRHPKWFYDQPDALMQDNILNWNDDLQVMEQIYKNKPRHSVTS